MGDRRNKGEVTTYTKVRERKNKPDKVKEISEEKYKKKLTKASTRVTKGKGKDTLRGNTDGRVKEIRVSKENSKKSFVKTTTSPRDQYKDRFTPRQ